MDYVLGTLWAHWKTLINWKIKWQVFRRINSDKMKGYALKFFQKVFNFLPLE